MSDERENDETRESTQSLSSEEHVKCEETRVLSTVDETLSPSAFGSGRNMRIPYPYA